VIEGDTGAAVTIRVAAALVTLPIELLTTTLNWLPESDVAAVGVVYAAEDAPLMFIPFRCH
jgi:hypothetical protein